MMKVNLSSDFIDYLSGLLKINVNLPKPKPIEIGIAILSSGGGYTIPHAIESIERETKKEIKKINYYSPLDTSDLSDEVKIILNYIEKNNLQDKYLSRADAFINLVKEDKINFVNEKNEPIKKICLQIINDKTQEAKDLDGIFLPGGDDIPSIWYGGTECRGVYRSIVELTLINEARKKGIPLIGICRGKQIVNVYNGKKLEKHVPNQYGNQKFNIIEEGKKGLLAKIFQEGVTGAVMHNQGVSIREGTDGKGDLEVLTTCDGLVKAAESKYPSSSPIILTQFHPEMYNPDNPRNGLSANNREFIKIFHAGAVARANKRIFITPEKLAEGRKNLTPVETRQRSTTRKLNRITIELSRRFDAWIRVHIYDRKASN